MRVKSPVQIVTALRRAFAADGRSLRVIAKESGVNYHTVNDLLSSDTLRDSREVRNLLNLAANLKVKVLVIAPAAVRGKRK